MVEILYFLLVALGLNILLFIPAFIWKTDKLTDASYAITFIVLALSAFFASNMALTKTILFAMVLLWAFRLGVFLFIRIRKSKKDKRFDGIRESFWKFFTFWFVQGLVVWVLMIPAIMFSLRETSQIYWVGLVIWVAGLSIETVSDYQKYQFKQNAANKNKFIQVGLWKYSRHPNYFGEILCWLGIYIYVAASLPLNELLIAFISPLGIYLLLRYGSGIPKLEKYADSKWGKQKDYQEYKRKTNLLIPWFIER